MRSSVYVLFVVGQNLGIVGESLRKHKEEQSSPEEELASLVLRIRDGHEARVAGTSVPVHVRDLLSIDIELFALGVVERWS
jgi:hypothetical protein